MPIRSPAKTPRGTDRRVKRHSSLCRMRSPNGFSQGLRSTSSREGAFLWRKRCQKFGLLAMLPQKPALFPFPVAFFDRLALVMGFLALRQRNFDFRTPPRVEIDAQGN